MTEPKSPKDRLVELVVYGPVGLAATVVEEFPRLVEKGRHQVEGQVRTARLMGQFALQLGRRRIEQSVDRLGAQASGRSAPGPARRSPPRPAPSPGQPSAHAPSPPAPSPASASSSAVAPVPVPPSAAGPSPSVDGAASTPSPGPSAARPASPPAGGAPSSAANGGAIAPNLAIPGYDSLSASQVVQRLPGLSAAELEDVRDHEAAHRQRRTILHRVDQLLSGPPGGQP